MNWKLFLWLWAVIAFFSITFLVGNQTAKIYSTLEEAVPEMGKPVILVFFSTDCSLCWEDLFEMKYFVEKNNLSVEVVGITRVTKEDLVPFLEKYFFNRPVVLDSQNRLYRKFKVDLEPYKIILVKDTVIYKDDYYQPFLARREEAKKCLRRIGLK